jgi:glycosyltransferase involved in cell wall biosynthesis
MKIMVITPYLPHENVGHGGGSAVRDLVKHLARNHEVLLVSVVRPGENELIAEVEELGLRVAPLAFNDTQAKGTDRLSLMVSRTAALFRSVFSGFPHYVQKYWMKGLSDQILDLATKFNPDAIQIEYLQMSLYARDLAKQRLVIDGFNPRIILNTHELGSVPRHRRAARANFPPFQWWFRQEASRWEHLQVAAGNWVDRLLCVTEEDRLLYEAMGGTNLLTVPLGMDLEAIKPDRQPTHPPTCLFVGSFNHRPNVLAADLLIDHIWPKVLAERPDTRLILAGRGSLEHLEKNTGSTTGISATGFVEDLTPLFRQSTLFVAPLPEGGGIKIKILEAMARGIPVITTLVGAEGITTEQDDTMVITDAAHGFAEAIIQALDDPRSEKRALRGRQLMEEKFGWKAIAERLAGIYRAEE